MSTGTCTTHSWNDGAEEDEGIPRMGRRVNHKLQVDERLYGGVRMGPRSRFVVQRDRGQRGDDDGDGDRNDNDDDGDYGIQTNWW